MGPRSSAGPTVTTPSLVLGQIAREFPSQGERPRLSLVAPVYDEEANLRPLYQSVLAALEGVGTWELILVDDGSRDGSAALIRELSAEDERVVGVFFARNCGQTAAMGSGLQLARGELIATLDSDLQNDPADIPGMIAVLGEYDAVVGYRQKRNDNWVRRVSSRIANRVRNWLSKDSIRDTGCSLKLFRAEAIQAIPLFEGLHRFFPTLLRYHGFEVLEHPVSHRPRIAGESKYGVMNRAFRAFKDLLAVRWMHGRMIRVPIDEVQGRPRR
jgi:glycosyltransferase involved in cell wall biosynthesis